MKQNHSLGRIETSDIFINDVHSVKIFLIASSCGGSKPLEILMEKKKEILMEPGTLVKQKISRNLFKRQEGCKL